MKITDVIRESRTLTEGGNIWKADLATIRINRADVVPTVQFLEKVTGLKLLDNMLGSTGKKDTSGDLDLAVDATTNNKATLEAKLQAWAKKKDPTALTKKSGISVHFRTPIKGDPKNGYVQTDFMFVPDLKFAKWGMEAVPSKYKGADRQVLFASIAKSLGYKWSAQSGLLDRATNEPIPGGKDKATVAKLLLGPQAKADDITSVESILDVVMTQPDADAKLADFRDNMAKSGVTV